MEKIKVFMMINNLDAVYSFRKELVSELLAEGREVCIISPVSEKAEYFKNLGCKVTDIDMDSHSKNVFSNIRLFTSYLCLLKKEKPDVVLTYTIKPNVFGGAACSVLRIPYIVNITGLGKAVEYPGFLQKVTTLLYRIGLKRAQTVFFQNTENRDFMLGRKIVKRNYELLPGSGVNLSDYRVMPYPDEKDINFAFLSRVTREKGIEQYLKAAEVIHKKYPNTRFHIYGMMEQDYTERIRRYEEQGFVEYHGHVSEMQPVYYGINCTVHPSCYPEGMSNILLESAACGRPVITTDRSGCREAVRDGINGFIVKERSSKELICAIEKFLNLGWEKQKIMGLNGRKLVEKKFDRRIVVNKYLNEIRKAEKGL